MQIVRGAYVASLAQPGDYPGKGLPEIATVGKSNVGKSSLINRIAQNNKLARTSGEPGKTRLINIYSMSDRFFLVDLPGYGFARVSKTERERWGGMIENYLSSKENLCHVLQLVDIRHDPTEEDLAMVTWLRHYQMPFTVVATKADKISRGARMKYVAAICRKLVVQPWEIVVFSSDDGTGRDQLVEIIGEIITKAEAI